YEQWIKKNPEDVHAIDSAVGVLLQQQRYGEAQSLLKEAIKRSPTRADLRLRLVEVLQNLNQPAQVLEQMKLLVELDVNNPDWIVRLGQMRWASGEPDEDARLETQEIWERLLHNSEDSTRFFQVAELSVSIGNNARALELYSRAAELSSDATSIRQRWGELVLKLEGPEAALEIWKKIAEAPNDSAEVLAQLSRIYETNGLQESAIEAMQHVLERNPSFSHTLRCAELFVSAERFDEALELLNALEPDGSSTQLQQLLKARVKTYRAADRLAEAVEHAQRQWTQESQAQAGLFLSMLQEAGRDTAAAISMAELAIEKFPQQRDLLQHLVRLYQRVGRMGDQLTLLQKLERVDSAAASQHLRAQVSLLQSLGRPQEAVEAAQRLVEISPKSLEYTLVLAQTYLESRQAEEGLRLLRKRLRQHPNDLGAAADLAWALSRFDETEEAIETYWRLFSLAQGRQEKSNVIVELAELYRSQQQFAQFIERLDQLLEKKHPESNVRLWKALAYEVNEDRTLAAQELQMLLRQRDQDAEVLRRIVTLWKGSGKYEKALSYQEKLVALEPTDKNLKLQADMLLGLGRAEEASGLLKRIAAETKSEFRLVASAYDLLDAGFGEVAAQVLSDAIRRNPNPHWECRILLAQIRYDQEDYPEAIRLAQSVLEEDLDNSAPNLRELERRKRLAKSQGTGTRIQLYATGELESDAILELAREVSNVIRDKAQGGGYGYGGYGGGYGYGSYGGYGYGRYGYGSYGRSARARKPVPYVAAGYFQHARAIALGIHIESQGSHTKSASWDDDFVEKAIASGEVPRLWEAAFVRAWDQEEPELYESVPENMQPILESLEKAGDRTALFQRACRILAKGDSQSDRYGEASSSEQQAISEEDLQGILSVLERLSGAPQYGYLITTLCRELGKSDRQQLARQLVGEYRESDDAEPETLVRLARTIASAPDWRIASEQTAGDVESEDWGLALSLIREALKDHKKNPTTVQNRYYGSMFYLPVKPLTGEQVLALEELLLDVRSQKLSAKASRGPAMNLSQMSWAKFADENKTLELPSDTLHLPARYQQHLYEATQRMLKLEALPEWEKSLWDIHESELNQHRSNTAGFVLAYVYAWTDRAESEEMDRLMESMAKRSELNNELGVLRYCLANDTEQAITILDELTPGSHDSVAERELEAVERLLKGGQLAAARTRIRNLVAIRMNSNKLFQVADLMQQLKIPEEARKLLDRVRAQAGNSPSSLAPLVSSYEQIGQLEEAESIAKQVIGELSRSSMNYDDEEYFSLAAQFLHKQGKLEEMIARWEQLRETAGESKLLLATLLQFYRSAGRYDELEELEMQLARMDQNAETQQVLAKVELLANKGDFVEALDLYLEALDESLDSPWPVEKLNLEAVAVEFERWDALTELTELSSDPDFLFRQLITRGKFEELERALMQRIEIDEFEFASLILGCGASLPASYEPTQEFLQALATFLAASSKEEDLANLPASLGYDSSGFDHPFTYDDIESENARTNLYALIGRILGHPEVGPKFEEEIRDKAARGRWASQWLLGLILAEKGEFAELQQQFAELGEARRRSHNIPLTVLLADRLSYSDDQKLRELAGQALETALLSQEYFDGYLFDEFRVQEIDSLCERLGMPYPKHLISFLADQTLALRDDSVESALLSLLRWGNYSRNYGYYDPFAAFDAETIAESIAQQQREFTEECMDSVSESNILECLQQDQITHHFALRSFVPKSLQRDDGLFKLCDPFFRKLLGLLLVFETPNRIGRAKN
ncbi:MAG: tetratricopeptide repeat protein, partial [Planctomycetota bacterium]